MRRRPSCSRYRVSPHLLGDVGDDAERDEIQVFDLFARMAGLGEEGFDQFVGYAYAR